jgi:hypothetical protein
LTKRTHLGYRAFRCSWCRRQFNQRTGTPFNYLQFPTDIVLLVVMWRLRYKLSLRDLAEMFLERGFEFTHETLREWEARFAPLVADNCGPSARATLVVPGTSTKPTFGSLGSGSTSTGRLIVRATWSIHC